MVDTDGGVDRDAVDWAARTAAGAVTRLAHARGCRVLLPGDRAPVHISSDLRGWPDVLRRLGAPRGRRTPEPSAGYPWGVRHLDPARDHRRPPARPARSSRVPRRTAHEPEARAGTAGGGWPLAAGIRRPRPARRGRLGTRRRLRCGPAVGAARGVGVRGSDGHAAGRRRHRRPRSRASRLAWLLTGLSPALAAPWHWAELGAGLAAGVRDLFPVASDAEGLTVWPRAAAAGLARRLLDRGRRGGASTRGEGRPHAGAAVPDCTGRALDPRPGVETIRHGCGGRGGAAGVGLVPAAGAWAGGWAPRSRPGWTRRGGDGRRRRRPTRRLVRPAGLGGPTATEVRGFDPGHSYGPLTGERDGTTLLRVDPRGPRYWRVRVLSRFDGGGWARLRATRSPTCRSPAPTVRRSRWRCWRCASRGIVSPGDVVDVDGVGTDDAGAGGEVTVDAFTSRAGSELPRPGRRDPCLAGRARRGAAARRTTRRVRTRRSSSPGDPWRSSLFGSPIPPPTAARLERSHYRRTLALARRLSRAGRDPTRRRRAAWRATSSSGSSYDTEVEDGDRPLEDFLFDAPKRLLPALLAEPPRCCCASPASPPAWSRASHPVGTTRAAAYGRSATSMRIPGSRCTSRGSAGSRWTPPPARVPAAVPPGAEPLRAETEDPASSPCPRPGRRRRPRGALHLGSDPGPAAPTPRPRRREAVTLLRALAGRTSPLPPRGDVCGARSARWSCSCGPETALLAQDLEVAHFLVVRSRPTSRAASRHLARTAARSRAGARFVAGRPRPLAHARSPTLGADHRSSVAVTTSGTVDLS